MAATEEVGSAWEEAEKLAAVLRDLRARHGAPSGWSPSGPSAAATDDPPTPDAADERSRRPDDPDDDATARQASRPGADGHPHAEHQPCTWCPLCRVMAGAQGSAPDAAAQVIEAGLALFAAVRTFVESFPTPEPPPRPTATADEGARGDTAQGDSVDATQGDSVDEAHGDRVD